jgi:hypothetical protein
MAKSSLLGIDADNLTPLHSAKGNDSLGPSDTSDSGSDSAGVYDSDPDNDTDRQGTGERASVEPDLARDARDILPDHLETLDSDDFEGGLPDTRDVRAGVDRYPGDDAEDVDPDTDDDAGD